LYRTVKTDDVTSGTRDVAKEGRLQAVTGGSGVNVLMCGSRKYPYPPHGRSLEIPRGRGFKGRNFRGEWGVHGKLLFQRVKKHEKIETNARLFPSTK